jgi:hypothetical protein
MATVAHALTSLQRVKDRLGITVSGFDSILERMIDASTDMIESYCARRFKETVYSNELIGIESDGGRMAMLKQAPVTILLSVQYRAGTPDNPSWTPYLASDFELVGDGTSGLVRIYGGVPRGTNNLRVSYTAGYKINFADSYNLAQHTLPFDLSDVCERLVVKAFKKRESAGKQAESAGEASTTWMQSFEAEELAALDRYRRVYLG